MNARCCVVALTMCALLQRGMVGFLESRGAMPCHGLAGFVPGRLFASRPSHGAFPEEPVALQPCFAFGCGCPARTFVPVSRSMHPSSVAS